MDRRNPWTIAAGLTLVALGVLWMVDNVADLEIPLRWVAPALIVVAGLMLLFGKGNGGGNGGKPPSQFERDGAPRVP